MVMAVSCHSLKKGDGRDPLSLSMEPHAWTTQDPAFQGIGGHRPMTVEFIAPFYLVG